MIEYEKPFIISSHVHIHVYIYLQLTCTHQIPDASVEIIYHKLHTYMKVRMKPWHLEGLFSKVLLAQVAGLTY